MIDLKIIQEKYASMADIQLINLARHDSHDLTAEAMLVLKQEFAKRNMDIDSFLSVKKEPEMGEDEESLDGSELLTPVNDSISGIPYHPMMMPTQVETEENPLSNTEEDELRRLIKKCDSHMVINGVFFIVGFAISALTLLSAMEDGGGYIITWGAVLFGGIGFFRAMSVKSKLKTALKEMTDKKEGL